MQKIMLVLVIIIIIITRIIVKNIKINLGLMRILNG